MNWVSFAWGFGAGVLAAVVAWFIIFVKLMSEGDQ